MPYTESPGPRIYYEVQGSADDEPLVLIEGMGAQMIGWRQGFVDMLAARGFRVIRMDNRDVGLSEKLGNWRQHDACYSLRDMADDVCRVLDALGVQAAHIVGQSMGGIIAQTLGLYRADRVLSLCLVYTAPAFSAEFVQPDFAKKLQNGLPKLPFRIPRWVLLRMFNTELQHGANDEYALDPAWARELIKQSYARGFRLDGVARQSAAVRKSGFDYRSELGTIKAPTTIIQGTRDHAVQTGAAFALAAGIPDSALHVYPGMGHVVAEPLWEEFTTVIAANARRAGARLN